MVSLPGSSELESAPLDVQLDAAGRAAEAAAWRERGAAPILGLPPLLLLPGTACDHELWSDVMPALAAVASPRVARIDLDDSVAGMAATVLASAPPRFALAGHSQGAIVCLEILRQAPLRVTRVALLNASARPPDERQLESWAGLRDRAEGDGFARLAHDLAAAGVPAPGGVRDRVEAMAYRMGPAALVRQLRAQATRPDGRPHLGAIGCPALVVAGAQDEVCPPALQRELAAGIQSAGYEVIEGCGHFAPLEHPARVAALLARFMADAEVKGSSL